ncbi:sulfur reduction protein DsrJ [Thiohalobacter sp. IOR34]|uniref:sulfur reduction protein DsrJ n=1 Tax=Thiohalobacter sp. IOR34 TaxID=3057176 RepID=UPI0025B1EE39|nr:sulfur reduction protein DsrJ [Thiohalobacter sp. IOR34]WJW74350.1 sulfur reduction protein DsrJ [Thiohalobacter sp. IOR34]
MTRLLQSLHALLLAAGLALASLPLLAQAEVPLPQVPEAKARVSDAQGCVAPTAEMRKNHMKYLLKHRDEALREGIRTKRFSLEQCINCHVPEADSAEAVHVDSEKHFCKSCHSYAAVTIDCFECHRDTPTPKHTGFHAVEGQLQ